MGTVVRVPKYTTTRRLRTNSDVDEATELVRHPWMTFPQGVEAMFGEVSGVAMLLAHDDSVVAAFKDALAILAGKRKKPHQDQFEVVLNLAQMGDDAALGPLRNRAEQATKQAHRAFAYARRVVAEAWLSE
jgi:hypothetical protein